MNRVDRDWIDWTGGECPVHAGLTVEYKMRDGGESKSFADDLDWRHFPDSPSICGGDIVAYRVVKS